jgi:hypothetical protein
MSDRHLSLAVGEKFLQCLDSIHELHEVFMCEGDSTSAAILNALRTYMIATAAYLSRSGGAALSDVEFRAALHSLLDKGIDDYQFNERLHVHRGD